MGKMSSIMVYFILVGDIIQSTFLLLVIYKAVCHILRQNSSDHWDLCPVAPRCFCSRSCGFRLFVLVSFQ